MGVTELLSMIGGAIGALLSAGPVSQYVKTLLDKKERVRLEAVEAKKVVLRLLPAMKVAEREYKDFLAASIHLHDLEGDLAGDHVPQIYMMKPNSGLVKIIDEQPLHLLLNRFSVALADYQSDLKILEQELSSMQSSLLFDYDHPENLARLAKEHLEKRLSVILLAFHQLRQDLTYTYLGKDSWPKAEKTQQSDLQALWRKAHAKRTLSDRFSGLRFWTQMKYAKLYFRLRSWRRRVERR